MFDYTKIDLNKLNEEIYNNFKNYSFRNSEIFNILFEKRKPFRGEIYFMLNLEMRNDFRMFYILDKNFLFNASDFGNSKTDKKFINKIQKQINIFSEKEYNFKRVFI